MILTCHVPLYAVVLEFRRQHGRFPNTASLDDDKAQLAKLRETVLDELKVSRKVVPEDFVK